MRRFKPTRVRLKLVDLQHDTDGDGTLQTHKGSSETEPVEVLARLSRRASNPQGFV